MTDGWAELVPLPDPRTGRPSVPGYGIPAEIPGTLPWTWAEERLELAETYWVATTRPDGRPHLVPIWAAWLDRRLWFEGGSATRRARNIAAAPAISVAVDVPRDGAVIVEGIAERRVGLPAALADRLVAAFSKYAAPPRSYHVDPAAWEAAEGGIWFVTPRTVLGWSSFPADATRWRFEPG